MTDPSLLAQGPFYGVYLSCGNNLEDRRGINQVLADVPAHIAINHSHASYASYDAIALASDNVVLNLNLRVCQKHQRATIQEFNSDLRASSGTYPVANCDACLVRRSSEVTPGPRPVLRRA